jgi:hypothetical protein
MASKLKYEAVAEYPKSEKSYYDAGEDITDQQESLDLI